MLNVSAIDGAIFPSHCDIALMRHFQRRVHHVWMSDSLPCIVCIMLTEPHTHPFNGRFSGTTRVSRYQKGKTNLDFTEARDSEWQWHQLGHVQVCISLQTDNHASTPPLSFLQAGCPSCRPTNSIKALKAIDWTTITIKSKCSYCLSSLSYLAPIKSGACLFLWRYARYCTPAFLRYMHIFNRFDFRATMLGMCSATPLYVQ